VTTKPTRALIAAAIVDSPRSEICGFILRCACGEERFVRVRNLHSGWRFCVSPGEVERTLRIARTDDCEVLAFVHSHKTSLLLSQADIESLACSEVPWMVVRLRDESLEEVAYEPAFAKLLLASGGIHPRRPS
jgi:proteasome lid subunit RPN8/RPN11